jgi:hypothetical protein
MRRIVIIDNKIDDEEGILRYLSKRNVAVVWDVRTSVPLDNSCQANLLFIHINNRNAQDYIKQYYSYYDEIYITSTEPSLDQLNRITGCSNAKLFTIAVPNGSAWKALPWERAIEKWQCGQPFPIDMLYVNHFTYPECLIAAYLLLIGEQAGLVIDDLDSTGLWENAGRQFWEEVEKRNLEISGGEVILKMGWSHPTRGNISSCVSAIRALLVKVQSVF